MLDGLNDPRGLLLRTDGSLCVAEAGRLTEGQEVRSGPTTNLAETGSVTCVDNDGHRQRVSEHLPYVFYNVTGLTTGPSDVAEIDGALYLLTGEGHASLARSLLRITDLETPPDVVADFLAFATDTATPDFFDEINIISNPFAMIADADKRRFLVTDGATGQILAADLDGHIEVYSNVEGHEVLTGIVRGPDGLPYVASFSQLPHSDGAGTILRFQPDGKFSVVLDNLTTPIDLAFDEDGRLYVLEFVYAAETGDPYREKTGRLLRFEREGDGGRVGQVLVEGLPFPTALLIDADDRVYISVRGAFSPPNSGAVLRFDALVQRAGSESPIVFQEDVE